MSVVTEPEVRPTSWPAHRPTRRGGRRLGRLALGVAGALTVGAAMAGLGVARSVGGGSADALGPGEVTVVLDVRHSRFVQDHLRIRAGTLVHFEVRNADPIRHELVVGPDSVHALHGAGHEATHPPVPGEVTVDPHQTGDTFYVFDQPGVTRFACHLPGHYQYGMKGEIEVISG